jgi:hypothetical protein
MNMTLNAARRRRGFGTVLALALTGAALSGCVYYPQRYAYNGYSGGYYGGYYAPAPAVVVAPPVVVGGGWWGWGHGWGGYYGRGYYGRGYWR